MLKKITPDQTKINKKTPIISIVISFLNEENNIDELIKRIRNTLDPIITKKIIKDYEIIFVNDNSKDKSEAIISKYIKKDSRIILINTSRNFGNVECNLIGISYSKGDAIITIDADLQDPPELFEILINEWKTNDFEIVYTTRTKRPGESKFKLLLTKFGYRLINKISDVEIPIDSGDFRLISKRVKVHLNEFNEKYPYLRGIISYVGFPKKQIFYDRQARNDGQTNTKYPVFSKRVIWSYFDRALIGHSDTPLKIILFFGIFIFIISILYLFSIILMRLFTSYYIPGWTALMAAITFFSSIIIIMLGIIGLYIGCIFMETKNRPNYIIKDIVKKG